MSRLYNKQRPTIVKAIKRQKKINKARRDEPKTHMGRTLRSIRKKNNTSKNKNSSMPRYDT